MDGGLNVFISYAREDARDLAIRLRDDLRAAGCSVWLDLSQIQGGDSWTQSALGHDHFNFGFTAEGIYDVSFTITGTNSGIDAIAAGVYSDTATFRFVVGSAIITAVPEPSGLMLVGIALGGLAFRRRRGAQAC